MAIKSGYAAIIGKPNVGKSTLLNAALGVKLSIATNRPQTTRKRILGLLSEHEYQIIFLDTPGLLEPKYLLQEKMLEYALKSAMDADVILLLINMEKLKSLEKEFNDENLKKLLLRKNSKKILVLNKIDLSNQQTIDRVLVEAEALKLFDDFAAVSAISGFNINSLISKILHFLPEHPKYYPDDILTDAPERFFASEIIREKIFELYGEEIPYSCEVQIEEFKEREKGKDYIRAAIIVEKETQKPIIIGKKGEKIKKLGQVSREAIEAFLGREAFLELFVSVRPKWRTEKKYLKSFGYYNED